MSFESVGREFGMDSDELRAFAHRLCYASDTPFLTEEVLRNALLRKQSQEKIKTMHVHFLLDHIAELILEEKDPCDLVRLSDAFQKIASCGSLSWSIKPDTHKEYNK